MAKNSGNSYEKAMAIFSAAKTESKSSATKSGNTISNTNSGREAPSYDRAMAIFTATKANDTTQTNRETTSFTSNSKLTKAQTAAQNADQAYKDYISSSEARIYQKNYGKPSDKATELKNARDTAKAEADKAERQAKINSFAQMAAELKNNKTVKSIVDTGRAETLSAGSKKSSGIQISGGGNEAGIRAKEGSLAWKNDSYKAMTDDEVEVYNRLAKNGKQKEAEEFLKAITPYLNARVTQTRLDEAQKKAQDGVLGGIGASIASTLLKPVSAIQGGVKTILDKATGQVVDQNAPEYFASNLATKLRSSVAESIENGVYKSTVGDYTYDNTGNRRMTTEGEAKNNGKIASFLYQAGMSMADMYVMVPFGKAGMQAMMSSNAGVDTVIDAKNNGATDDQALALGVISGAAEAFFEKYSLENLLEGKVSRNAVISALKQTGIEASEEMATEITNILANEAIMGTQSDFNKVVTEYKEMGLNDKEAKAKALEEKLLQVLEAGAAGALVGFVMGGAADIMNTRAAGQSVLDAASTLSPDVTGDVAFANEAQRLQFEGKSADKNSTAYKVAQKNASTLSDLGRQYLANAEAISDTGQDLQMARNVPDADIEAGVDTDIEIPLTLIEAETFRNEVDAEIAELKTQLANARPRSDTAIEIRKKLMSLEAERDSYTETINEYAKQNAETSGAQQGAPYASDTIMDHFNATVGAQSTERTMDGVSFAELDNKMSSIDDGITALNHELSNKQEVYEGIQNKDSKYADSVQKSIDNLEARIQKLTEQKQDLANQRGRKEAEAHVNFNLRDPNIVANESKRINAPNLYVTENTPKSVTFDAKSRTRQLSEAINGFDLITPSNNRETRSIADIAEDTARMQEQTDYAKIELDFAKKLSQATQNLGVVNTETKTLGRKYFDRREDLPTLHDIQNKNVEDFTSDDFAVIAKALVGGGKMRLYTKETSRVFDTVAGGNKQLRNILYNTFEKPFNEAGGNYGKSLTSAVESYKEIMRKFNIKPKSIEDKAAQWYGEGQRQGPDGDLVSYTIADLQRDCPDTWENVKGFAEANKEIYDGYLNKINTMMEMIYPNVLENAQAEYEAAFSRLEIASGRTKALTRAVSEKQKTIEQLKEIRNSKKRHDTTVFADLESRITAEETRLESMKKDLETAEKKEHIYDMETRALWTAIDTGAIYEGKRILPRNDYFHHAQEMLSDYNIIEFFRPKNTTDDISPSLAGVSDQTKPRSRWWGAMFRRNNGEYFASASNGMASYIGMAEYKLAYDPLTSYLRNINEAIRTSAQTVNTHHASGFIEWMKDWTDGLAGKSDHTIDRGVQKLLSRQTLNSINNLNKRVRANLILGNFRTAGVQFSNIANAAGYITSPGAWKSGIQAVAEYRFNPDSKLKYLMSQSQFMSQRYGTNTIEVVEKDGLSPKKVAVKMLDLLQHLGDDLTWFSAYAQFNENPDAAMSGMFRQYDNAVDYADDITRRAVAGRGVGEGALALNSKVINTFAPFQTEVLNQWNSFFEHTKKLRSFSPEAKKRAAKSLASLEISTYLFNAATTAILGDKLLGFDFIGAVIEALTNYNDDDDEDKNAYDLFRNIRQSVIGTIADAAPLSSLISGFVDDETNERIFGKDYSPTRYGSGNVGIQAAADAVLWGIDTADKIFGGAAAEQPTEDIVKSLDWEGGLEAVGNFVTPWGGTQLSRTVKGLETFFRGGKHDRSGNLQYAVAQTPVNFLRAATLGRSALPEHQKWIANGFDSLNEKESAAFQSAKEHGGTIKTFAQLRNEYKAMVAEDDAKNQALEERKKEIKMGNPDLTNAEAMERAEMDLGYKEQNSAYKWAKRIAEDPDLTNEQKADYLALADLSVSTIEDIKALTDYGVPVDNYVSVISSLADKGLKAKDSDLVADDKREITHQIYGMTGLTERQKTALVRKTIGDDWIVDFSSKAAFSIANDYGKSEYKKYSKAKKETGITAEQYIELKERIENKAFKGTGDDGKTVYYLKQCKLANYVDNLDASEAVKKYIWDSVYTKDDDCEYEDRHKKLVYRDGAWYTPSGVN